MTWIFAAVSAGVAGLAALAVPAARVLVAARELGGELDRARRSLRPTGDEFPVTDRGTGAGGG
ncbi:hypothetical protein JOL79_07760 [Microbispora sp. RL4-1S]|uniref:Uncharacterized protein n=1 Tax=Microbispora oryzae TaxID=2806554 RepID=A0A940WDZ4_9ACTN|nr:hypothetical protein [Microbispora oryzae]MBP2703696.1 hypothetical protein [Microbispora oryzae]